MDNNNYDDGPSFLTCSKSIFPATILHRRLVIQAAIEAGFQNVFLLREPIVASLTLPADDNRCDLIFDLGAGTLDVSIVAIDTATNSRVILACAGNEHIGGGRL